MNDLDLRASLVRFAELIAEASDAYQVPVRHIIDAATHKYRAATAAREDILHALEMEFSLSNPELALLFRVPNHSMIVYMRKRMYEHPREWKLSRRKDFTAGEKLASANS